jgi:type III pantothenate kinase
MNLVIDVGNTRVKTGVFSKGKLLRKEVFNSINTAILQKLLKDFPEITHSILCSVRNYPAEVNTYLSARTKFVELNYKVRVPVTITYKTPETLGMDRLAAVCGAYILYKRRHVLIVNAGTCITYDFLSANGVYQGGSISPGLEMRFKALHTFTGKLPLIEPSNNTRILTGTTTKEAIVSGVQQGMLKEVEGIAEEYRKQYGNLLVIGTGGDLDWMLKSLKIKIKAEPNLVLTGLNVILSPFERKRSFA